MVLLLIAGVTAGCGKNEKLYDRLLFNSVDLSEYVDLCETTGITVDTSSEKFEEYYDEVVTIDVERYDFYQKITEGKVESGNVVNIDFAGYLDGVAFDGGTSEGYELEIGSGSFIDGFEEGLIGVEIGSTIDLPLTFPTSYSSTELAGKDVVFTITVNYVKTDVQLKPEEFYSELGYSELSLYEEYVVERAAMNYLLDYVVTTSIVESYPKADEEYLLEKIKESMDNALQTNYYMTTEEYLAYVGQSMEDYEAYLCENQVYPLLDNEMVVYAILDAAGVEITEKDADDYIADLIGDSADDSSAPTADDLIDYYGKFYFEILAAREKVNDYLYSNAVIS